MDEKKTAEIEGWLGENEGKLLYELARKCTGKGVIVEIGSWKGKSTIHLAKGSKAGKNIRVYAIDPHTGSKIQKEKFGKLWTFNEFKNNIMNAGLSDIVTPLVKTSEEAAREFKEPVELVFIDGDHDYEMVKLDFELWCPKLVEGGIIACHDTTNWPGPKKAAEKFIYKSGNFKNIGLVGSITYAEKSDVFSPVDKLRNSFVFLLKRFYDGGLLIMGRFR